MPEATHDLVIERSVEEVFAFLADSTNDAVWRPAGAPRARRLLSTAFEITEVSRNSSIRIRGKAGFVRPVGIYELARVADGTRVRFVLAAKPRGFRRALTPIVRRAIETEVASLPNLKAVLERGSR